MEKYGTIPPRFTKAWWSYFWEYYKWHTIATAFVAILIITTAVQCANQPKYDMSITYVSSGVIAEDTANTITTALGEIINDADENGERNVFLQQLTIGMENADPQYEMAMQTKLMLEFTAGESFLFIFSKDQLNTYLNQEGSEDLFLPLSEWVLDQSVLESIPVSKAGGVARAASLGESAYFKSLGLDMKDYYIAMRAMRLAEEDDKELYLQLENSKIAGSYLLSR